MMDSKSFAIEECGKIPSNDEILMGSFNITHSTTRRSKDSLFEEHIITIEWTQIREKCDNDHDCEHCDWVECPIESEE